MILCWHITVCNFFVLFQKPHRTLYIFLIYVAFTHVQCAVRDLTDTKPTLYRNARDDRYYLNRYGSSQSTTSRSLKPEDRPEARATESGSNVEKRCSRCNYNDPYYDHRVQDRAYDDRDRYYDRYDDRRYDDRYDYRGYEKDRYDRYDNRYDRPAERDRWYDRRYEDRYVFIYLILWKTNDELQLLKENIILNFKF